MVSLEEYVESCYYSPTVIDENDPISISILEMPDGTDNSTYLGRFYNETHIGSLFDSEDKCKKHPNMALLSTMLTFGTFLLAFIFRQFRASSFLSSKVRRTIGDFGVPIAILIMVCASLGATDVHLQKANFINNILCQTSGLNRI